jgi:hypothetical protein
MAAAGASASLVLLLSLCRVFTGSPASAQAHVPSTRPARPQVSSTGSTSYGILIGPLRAKGGFTVQLEVDNCGTASSAMLVEYLKGSTAATLDHSYQGPAPQCSVTPGLGRTVLKVRWGSVVNLDLEMAGTGKLDEQQIDSSCGTSFFESRTAESSGTGSIAIHPSALGRVSFSKVTAHLLGDGSSGCTANGGAGTLPLSGSNSTKWFARLARPTAPDALASLGTTTDPSPLPVSTPTSSALPSVNADGSGSQFWGVFDPAQSLVITASSQSPDNPLMIISDTVDDDPATGVSGTMSITVNTTDAFVAYAGDSSAQLVANAVFAKGILNFTATADCSRVSNALDGTLTGAIVVRDPVFGTITYDGGSALGAAVGNADASLQTC